MTAKIKTKADLVAFIQALPDNWVPTKCIQWHSPECVAVVQGGPDEYEARQYVEIEIEGPRVAATIGRGMIR